MFWGGSREEKLAPHVGSFYWCQEVSIFTIGSFQSSTIVKVEVGRMLPVVVMWSV